MAIDRQQDMGQTRWNESAEGGVSGRAIVVGLCLALLVIVWNTHVEYIAHTARMNITHFPIALFVPYVVLTLSNAVLRRFGVSWALTSTELLSALAMGLVGAAVPAYGLTSYFLGMIAIPYYQATPENQWANYFHQFLPEWLVPSNEGGAMQYLFEGLPSRDMPIPWGVWQSPEGTGPCPQVPPPALQAACTKCISDSRNTSSLTSLSSG
ncbi:MAG: hypothetical protein O7G87_00195 [bacterium]|nr:hypothetical protein [bacterium]